MTGGQEDRRTRGQENFLDRRTGVQGNGRMGRKDGEEGWKREAEVRKIVKVYVIREK